MKDKVCVVTVTYGNRFHLLKQVIEVALSCGLHKIIVVDNNSDLESKNKLVEYEKLHNDKIKVLYLNDNYGSAGGYKRGLETAYNDPECEFIWLLDDDCVPEKNALTRLVKFYNKKLQESDNNNFALCSFRPAMNNSIKLLADGKKKTADLIFRKYNTYKGFHILGFPFYLLMKLKIIDINKKFDYDIVKTIEVDAIGYSGLFFNKKIIQKIGYPDEGFYLYEDDIDYTYRITKKWNGKIFVVMNSLLQDLELSYSFDSFSIVSLSCYKLYYSLRNTIIIEKKYNVKNSFVFNINKYTFRILLKILYFIKYISKERYQLVIKALDDGERCITGKTYKES